MISKFVATQLRHLANWLDPPGTIYIKIKFDASELVNGIEHIQRLLKAPGVNGAIP